MNNTPVVKIPPSFHMILQKGRHSIVPMNGERYYTTENCSKAVSRAIKLSQDEKEKAPWVVYDTQGKLVYRPALV